MISQMERYATIIMPDFISPKMLDAEVRCTTFFISDFFESTVVSTLARAAGLELKKKEKSGENFSPPRGNGVKDRRGFFLDRRKGGWEGSPWRGQKSSPQVR